MSLVSLDLSGIARGQPRIPEPIADALEALQTGINSIDETQLNAARVSEILDLLFDGFTDVGPYTPVVSGGTSAGVGTYTTQLGQYIKIGKLVIFSARITTTAHTGTGNYQISLPVAAQDAINTGQLVHVAPASGFDLEGTTIQVVGLISKGASVMTIQEIKDNAGWVTTQMQAAYTMFVHGSYLTD
jgi:hypothetical protein